MIREECWWGLVNWGDNNFETEKSSSSLCTRRPYWLLISHRITDREEDNEYLFKCAVQVAITFSIHLKWNDDLSVYVCSLISWNLKRKCKRVPLGFGYKNWVFGFNGIHHCRIYCVISDLYIFCLLNLVWSKSTNNSKCFRMGIWLGTDPGSWGSSSLTWTRSLGRSGSKEICTLEVWCFSLSKI